MNLAAYLAQKREDDRERERVDDLTEMHQDLRQDYDRLRDRLYQHEKATHTELTQLTAFVDRQQDELTGINGVDGDRIDNLAAAVDQHSEKLATIYGKDLGRVTALENWLRTESDRVSDVVGSVRALEGVLEDPAAAFKIQYRFGREPWKDFEPDTPGGIYVALPGVGSTIAMRMVRK
jgi:hypothetical protein